MGSAIETSRKILQETVAPGISDLRERLTRVEVEIKRLDDKIDGGLVRLDNKIDGGLARLDNKIDSVRGEMSSLRGEMNSLRGEMNSLRGELKAEIHHLDDKLTTALEIRERLAALEAKVATH